MPFGGPHRTRAAGLKLAIIRVRAKANDAQLAVIRRHCDAFNRGPGHMREEKHGRQNSSRLGETGSSFHELGSLRFILTIRTGRIGFSFAEQIEAHSACVKAKRYHPTVASFFSPPVPLS